MKIKPGSITKEPGAYITVHEQAVGDYFASLGRSVIFIADLRIKHIKTADMIMNNEVWEIKTPTGNGSRTIENILRSSKRQSSRVVLDIRFTKRTDTQVITEAKHFFRLSKRLQKLTVIMKNGKLKEFLKR